MRSFMHVIRLLGLVLYLAQFVGSSYPVFPVDRPWDGDDRRHKVSHCIQPLGSQLKYFSSMGLVFGCFVFSF